MTIGRRLSEILPAAPILLGAGAGVFAAIPSAVVKWSVALIPGFLLLLCWTLRSRHRWIIVFFASAILLPPLPVAIGDSGPHLAVLFAAIGVLAGVLSMPRWRSCKGPLPLVFALFIAILVESVAFAALYSGALAALGSLARVLLFAIGPFVFVYAMSVPQSVQDQNVRYTRFLFRMSVAAAVFACIDFYFQLPAPAGYGEQFVWLGDLVMRRAQGLFYEASTLGNFCAFFLVMISAALACGREERPCSLWELGAGGIALSLALVFSYSRGSLLNLFCAGIAVLYLRRATSLRWVLPLLLALCAAATWIYLISPSFGQSYWLRIETSVLDLPSAPTKVLSGRLANWSALAEFISRNPWQLLFGVGYKTLPYSDYTGRMTVADNTYLDLLIETGVLGLASFVALNGLILRSAFRAARSTNGKAQFFGTWISAFWIGELVQMISGDLITYWRVLPIYLWVLAAAIRESAWRTKALQTRNS